MAGMKDALFTFLAMAAILVGILFLVTVLSAGFGSQAAVAAGMLGVVLVSAGAARLWIKSSFHRG
jgi:hypothetical protein